MFYFFRFVDVSARVIDIADLIFIFRRVSSYQLYIRFLPPTECVCLSPAASARLLRIESSINFDGVALRAIGKKE